MARSSSGFLGRPTGRVLVAVTVSRGNFDAARFPEVQAMTAAAGRYLIPAQEVRSGLP
jgi:hypothetical protein